MAATSNIAKKIFASAMETIAPDKLARNSLHRRGDVLVVNDKEYRLKENVYVVGYGKAVLGMMRGVQDVLKDHIVRGVISVPYGTKETFKTQYQTINKNITVMEGARNNLPDNDAVKNADCIKTLAQSVSVEDILVVLTSGGGSALLPAPPPTIGLSNKLEAIKIVGCAGASIQQLNTVRKHLSELKGGKLAKLCSSENMISLIISDIVNNPIDLIASGPTVFDSSTAQDCFEIFKSLNIRKNIPPIVVDYLKQSVNNTDGESKMGYFTEQCNNVIIGSNKILVESAATKAEELGYKPYVLTTELEGDSTETGYMFAEIVSSLLLREPKSKIAEILARVNNAFNPDEFLDDCDSGLNVCLITAGETTVQVKGCGRGGRNQQLILSALLRMRDLAITHKHLSFQHMCLFSAGTDGQDGPTDAAGAFCDGNLVEYSTKFGVDVKSYLDNNASYDFFSDCCSGEYMFKTGLTGTNVMDIQLFVLDLSRHK